MAEGPRGLLFMLADGLGGHGRGDEASQAVVRMSAETFRSQPSVTLEQCFQRSQEYLLAEQIRLGAQDEMKTTLALLWLEGETARSGHIGDSRVYHFRKNKLLFRSLDHSVPQMLVVTGEIREKDIRHHEDRNRLLRVMGMEWTTPKYEIHPPVQLLPGDSFLLCSDGFWEYIEEKRMIKALKGAKSPEEWLQAMEPVVLAAGKGHNMDNYSATAVWVR